MSGVHKREENLGLEVDWQVAMRPGQRRRLEPGSDEALAEKVKASVRAKVEHPFLVVASRCPVMQASGSACPFVSGMSCPSSTREPMDTPSSSAIFRSDGIKSPLFPFRIWWSQLLG